MSAPEGQQANAQMRGMSFADRRPDRIVWPGRQWQWASLRFEDGDFNTAERLDVDARAKVVLSSNRCIAGDVPT